MRIPKASAFIASNLISFTVSLFVSWISFSAFSYTFRRPVHIWHMARYSGSSLHSNSPFAYHRRIVADFAYHVYPIAIPLPLLIIFCKVKCHTKGIAKERQIWGPVVSPTTGAMTQGNIFQEAPLASKNIGTNFPFQENTKVLLHLNSTSDVLYRSFLMLVFCFCPISYGYDHGTQQRNCKSSALSR